MRNNLIRVFINQAKIVEVSKYSSVFSFKKKIVDSVYKNDNIDNFVMTHNHEILENNFTLSSYNIKDNSNIIFDYKINGGSASVIENYKYIFLLLYLFIALPLSWIFFTVGVPSILSSIIITYFKKKTKSPIKKFLMQFAQLFFLFWFIVIFLTLIVLIPYYFISQSTCFMFKNSTDLAWTGGIIYIVFFIIYYFFDIINFDQVILRTVPQSVLSWLPIYKIVNATKSFYDANKIVPAKIMIPGYYAYTNMLYYPIHMLYEGMSLIGLVNTNDNENKIKDIQSIIYYLSGSKPYSPKEFHDKMLDSKNVILSGGTFENNFADALNISKIAEYLTNTLSSLQKNTLIDNLKELIKTIRDPNRNDQTNDSKKLYDNYMYLSKVIHVFKPPSNFMIENISANKLYDYIAMGPVLALPVLIFIPIKILIDVIRKVLGY